MLTEIPVMFSLRFLLLEKFFRQSDSTLQRVGIVLEKSLIMKNGEGDKFGDHDCSKTLV